MRAVGGERSDMEKRIPLLRECQIQLGKILVIMLRSIPPHVNEGMEVFRIP